MHFAVVLFIILAAVGIAPTAEATADKRYIKKLVDRSEIMMVLHTGSMNPTFDENYILICTYRPFSELKIGDVICYRRKVPLVVDGVSYYIVCHRIWNISKPDGKIILVKGDANNYIDANYVTESNYDCMVVGWVRKDVVTKDLPLALKIPNITAKDAQSRH